MQRLGLQFPRRIATFARFHAATTLAVKPKATSAARPRTPKPKLASKTRIPKAKRMTPAEVLAAQFKATLPPYVLPLNITLPRPTASDKDVGAYIQQVQTSQNKVTAFDMEWNASYVRGQERRVGLIQIAHSDAGLLLYSVSRTATRSLPAPLLDYIADPSIVKLGVHIHGDALKLTRDFPGKLPMRGQVDLSDLAHMVDVQRWASHPNALISLQRLAATYLHRYLDKGDVRRSNWEGLNLPRASLLYAAMDVQATLDIRDELLKVGLMLGASKGIDVDLWHMSTKRANLDLAPRMLEAWDRMFTTPDNLKVKLETTALAMDVEPQTVLGVGPPPCRVVSASQDGGQYILEGAARRPNRVALISPFQARQLVALVEFQHPVTSTARALGYSIVQQRADNQER